MAYRMKEKRLRLLKSTGDTCWICGSLVDLNAPPNAPNAPTLDHVIPRAVGGVNHVSNLRVAHAKCNANRGTKAIPSPVECDSPEQEFLYMLERCVTLGAPTVTYLGRYLRPSRTKWAYEDRFKKVLFYYHSGSGRILGGKRTKLFHRPGERVSVIDVDIKDSQLNSSDE